MSTDDEAFYEALTAIAGVGDARAAEILDVVEAHTAARDEGAVRDALEDAISYADQGDYEYAMQFVRDAYAELE